MDDQKYHEPTDATLNRLNADYYDVMSSSKRFSLQSLFNSDAIRLDEFCKEFSPHPQGEELKEQVESYSKSNGVWLSNATHHLSCALFLYPGAEPQRMLTMMKNLTIDFYLNDVMGRDTFKFLTIEEQASATEMIQRMSNMNASLYADREAPILEIANAEVLREFKESSPEGWFRNFLRLYCHHIDITHRDVHAQYDDGSIVSVPDYLMDRCHLGGVHHIITWLEYSNGQFLNQDELRAARLGQRLRRLHWLMAAFAGSSNDFFSFEKEVVDNRSDSNLIAVMALNNPSLNLSEIIVRASGIVRNLLAEIILLTTYIKKELEKIERLYPDLSGKLKVQLGGALRWVQATWLWQVYTKRYKRQDSIWSETALLA
jgi:hypothetical protein